MLISFAVNAKLICVFVFAYANCWFSHEAAQIVNLDFFHPGKIVTSLVDISQWNGPFSKLFSGKKVLFVSRIFEFFAALFKTFGMQNHGMVIFVLRCFRKEILKKAVSLRWCMDSSSLCHRKDRSLTRPYPEN